MGIRIPEVVEAERIHKAGTHTPEVDSRTAADTAADSGVGTEEDKAAGTEPQALAAERMKERSESSAGSTGDESPQVGKEPKAPVHSAPTLQVVKAPMAPKVLLSEQERFRRLASRSRCPSS